MVAEGFSTYKKAGFYKIKILVKLALWDNHNPQTRSLIRSFYKSHRTAIMKLFKNQGYQHIKFFKALTKSLVEQIKNEDILQLPTLQQENFRPTIY